MEKNLYNTHSRRFFETSRVFLGVGHHGASALTAGAQEKFKLGLQLYTIRDAMAKDLRGALNA